VLKRQGRDVQYKPGTSSQVSMVAQAASAESALHLPHPRIRVSNYQIGAHLSRAFSA